MVLLKPRNLAEFERQLKNLNKPNAIVFVGMHEESEATGALAEHPVEGKPLHEYFDEKTVFVRVPEKFTASSVYPRAEKIILKRLRRYAERGAELKGFSAEQVRVCAAALLNALENLPRGVVVNKGERIFYEYHPIKKIREFTDAWQLLSKQSVAENTYTEIADLLVREIQSHFPPQEYYLMDLARKIHSAAVMINVHGHPGVTEDEFISPHDVFFKSALYANKEAGTSFHGRSDYKPSDLLVELAVPKQIVKPGLLTPGNVVVNFFQVYPENYRGFSQRTIDYLSRIDANHSDTLKFLDDRASALKKFLWHFIRRATGPHRPLL